MNQHLADKLSGAISKNLAIAIAEEVLEGHYTMGEFMKLFFSNDWRIGQRAAWPLATIADRDVMLLVPYMDNMISAIASPRHDAVIRNILRAWDIMDIPLSYHGAVYEICFTIAGNRQYTHAMRAYSISICDKLCQIYPEMAEECIGLIEDQMLTAPPSIRSRGMRALKNLRKLKRPLIF